MKNLLLNLIIFISLGSFAFSNDLETIRKEGVLRVGVLEDYLPFSKQEDEHSFRGFEVELGKKLAERIFEGRKDYKVEFVPTRFVQRIPHLKENKADVIAALFPTTDAAKKEVDFTMPYLTLNTGILTRTEDNINTVKDLEDKKIALQTNTIAEDYLLSKNFNKDNFYYIKWYRDCYKAVKDRTVDACVGDNIALLGYPVVDTEVQVRQKNIGPYVFIAMGVAKGNKALADFINQELIELSKSGYFKESYENTFDPFYKGTADKKYFLLDDVYVIFNTMDN